MRKLDKEELVLEVSRAGAKTDAPPETLKAPARGFDWGDVIVGLTAASAAGPFEVEALPPYAGHPGSEDRDPFAFRGRLPAFPLPALATSLRRIAIRPQF